MTDIITGVVDETKLANIIIPSDKKKTSNSNTVNDDLKFGDDMLKDHILILNPSKGLAAGNNTGINGRRLGSSAAANIIKYLRAKY